MITQNSGAAPTDPTQITGLVVNIQHFCTQDGPGIRTTVFLKGCSVRCKWCSNPETIHRKPELAYKESLCIGEKECGECLKVCPENAIFVPEPGGKVKINWDLCTNCGLCPPVCPPIALYMHGTLMTVAEVIDEVEQDSAFYAESGGGLTISGGECQLQPDFTAALFVEAHKRGINTAIETASNVPWANFEKIMPHVDYGHTDIKHMDSATHKKWTGVPNTNILENLRRAYSTFTNTKFIARTPLIPGVNDSEENIRATLDFIRQFPSVVRYELLPYHRFGQSKYEFLGRTYELADFESPSAEHVANLRAIVDEAFGQPGISVPSQWGAAASA